MSETSSEEVTEVEFDEEEIFEGPPDDLDRGSPEVQDDEEEVE